MPWCTLLPASITFDFDSGNEKILKKSTVEFNYSHTLDITVVNSLVGVHTNGIFIYSNSTYNTKCTNKESVCVCVYFAMYSRELVSMYLSLTQRYI